MLAPVATRRHLLDLESWSASDLEGMLRLSGEVRDAHRLSGGKLDWLRGSILITLFYENSTRTRASFEIAGKALGAEVVNLTASSSSVTKGESLRDTILTLDALAADAIVIRHDQSGAVETASRWSRASIINAGDGCHAHPTQALLDLFTLRERLGALSGKRILVVGDILHSRVARSNCWALTALGAQVTLCGPPTLLPASFGAAFPGREVHVEYDLERGLGWADAVMALRLQRERIGSGHLPSLREYRNVYGLSAERMARYPHLPVLHPGPVNGGVEIDPAVAHGPQSLVGRQVENGTPVRMAVLLWATGRRELSPAKESHV
jgi:aspartate carbamoyltransferase catalytic subunit